VPPVESLGERLAAAVLARQQAAREREVRHEADTELAAAREDVATGVAPQERVLVLERGDVGGARRLVELLDVEVRDADRAHLSLAHELGHRPDRLGDRRDAVGPVVVEEVDAVGAKALKRRFEPAADGVPSAARIVAELRGEDDAVAAPLEQLAEEALAVAVAVDVGRVEEVDAGVEGGVDDLPRPREVDAAAEVVAAEPDARNGQRS